jgi:hypothetical protein
MFLKLDGKTYKIYWNHFSTRHESCEHCGHKEALPRFTECVVEAIDGARVATADADTNPKDQYVKKTGRDISYKRVAAHLVDLILMDTGYAPFSEKRAVKRGELMTSALAQYQLFCTERPSNNPPHSRSKKVDTTAPSTSAAEASRDN